MAKQDFFQTVALTVDLKELAIEENILLMPEIVTIVATLKV